MNIRKIKLAHEIKNCGNQKLIDHAILIAADEGFLDGVKILYKYVSNDILIKSYSKALRTVHEKEVILNKVKLPKSEKCWKYNNVTMRYEYIPAEHEEICNFLEDIVNEVTHWYYYGVFFAFPDFLGLENNIHLKKYTAAKKIQNYFRKHIFGNPYHPIGKSILLKRINNINNNHV